MGKCYRLIIIGLLAYVIFAIADVPQEINYQGKLTDPTGVAIDGTANILFRIYTAETSGTLLWTETHSATPVNKGLFDVILGSSTALNLPFDNQYWIELVVDGETLTPRQALNSVPYAYRAAIADSVVGGSGGGSSNWTLSGSSLYPNSTTSNVGVGMTSPSFKLEVQQNAGGPAGFGMKGATGAFNPAVSAVNDYTGFLVHTRVESGFPNMTSLVATGSVTGNYGGLMSFYTRNYGENPSERIRIDETGRVGIGTTSPTQLLDVNGTTRLRGHLYDYNNTSGTSGQVLARGASGVVWQDAAGGVGGSGSANKVAYWTSGSNLSYNNNFHWNNTSGYLGVGTASPAYRMHVAGPTSSTVLRVSHDGSAAGSPAFSVGYNWGSEAEKFTVASTGQVRVAIAHSGGDLLTVREGSTMIVRDAQLLFADGTSGAPGYSFVNDVNVGLFRPTSDALGFSTTGSERMRINSVGNVGIGTTSPVNRLHVSGPTSSAVARISHEGAISSPAFAVGYNSGGEIDKFTVSSTGQIRVAIAHTGGDHLTVREGSTMIVRDAQLLFADGTASAPGYSYLSDTNVGLFRPTTDALGFSTAGSERMRINSAGNVGIGTTSPAYNLHIQTTGGVSSAKLGYSSAYTDNRFYFGDGSYVWVGEYGADDRLSLRGSTMSLEVGYTTGSSGQVLTADGSGLCSWQTPSGGGVGLWQDDGSYIRPVEYDGFRIYDNTTGYVGLWFTSSTGVNTSAAANVYHANNEHAYIAYDNMCGLQGESDSENGVQGISSTSTADYAGVYGENSNSGSNVYGIFGYSQGYAGVLGVGPDYGLWAKDHGGITPAYGAWLYGSTYGLQCSGDLSFWDSSKRIQIGGDYGTAGEVLTSNGSSGIYWGTGGTGGSNWTVSGSNIYRNSNVGVGTSTTYPLHVQRGTTTYEIYAYNTYNSGSAGNQASIYGYLSSGQYGSGYGVYNTRASIKGYAFYGYDYTFGVAGYRFDDSYNRTGGVIGGSSSGNPPSQWGSLGYRNSGGTHYGGYFTNYTSGSGFRRPTPDNYSGETRSGIGFGASSDFMGGWVQGDLYGLHLKGSRYASYTDGNAYINGVQTTLHENGDGERAFAFTNLSTDVTVMASGTGNLVSGSCAVDFDDNFKAFVSSEIPVVVTVTPLIGCNPLYLASCDENGFTVIESEGGHSGGSFNWIALGRRKGYERTPNIPAEILAKDFDSNMERVMFNDGDASGNAQPFYWDGATLRFEAPPQSEQKINEQALKAKLEESPESLTPTKIAQLESMGADNSQFRKTDSFEKADETAYYDVYGTQIPPEWVDTLKSAGYPMFSYEEVMSQRLENYLSDAREINRSKENASPVPYEIEILQNGIHKYTDLQSGEVFFKDSRGYKVNSEGEIIYGDGEAKTPRIYELHPDANPANQDVSNNQHK